MVKIKSKILDIKKLTEGIKLTNGAKVEGPKCWFYELWDQNGNMKLIRGPKIQLSHKITPTPLEFMMLGAHMPCPRRILC